MATVYGLEQGQIEAGRRPASSGYQGKTRTLTLSFTTATSSTGPGNGPVNIADVLIAGFLPSGSVVKASSILAFGAFGAGATMAVGTYTRVRDTFTAVSAAKYLAATSVAAAGQTNIANTIALS